MYTRRTISDDLWTLAWCIFMLASKSLCQKPWIFATVVQHLIHWPHIRRSVRQQLYKGQTATRKPRYIPIYLATPQQLFKPKKLHFLLQVFLEGKGERGQETEMSQRLRFEQFNFPSIVFDPSSLFLGELSHELASCKQHGQNVHWLVHPRATFLGEGGPIPR